VVYIRLHGTSRPCCTTSVCTSTGSVARLYLCEYLSLYFYFSLTSDKGGGICFCPCLSVCQQDYSKTRAWIWMKCSMSTDVGTWTNWLTFEPEPDYSLDAGTGLLSPISYALQRGILLCWENPTYRYWAPIAAARRGFKMVLFTVSHGNTFVGSTCALQSALLVANVLYSLLVKEFWKAVYIRWNYEQESPIFDSQCSSSRSSSSSTLWFKKNTPK